MKKHLLYLLLFIVCALFVSAQNVHVNPVQDILSIPGKVAGHPEKGTLPFNAPCKDCEEDLNKRTGIKREFFKIEKGGSKTIYMQQSMGAMNYKDANGFWRTIDPILKAESENIFAARNQPASVVIDMKNKVTSISYAGKEFIFNKNLSLSHISAAGIETNLGAGDWSNISRSENYTQTIFLVKDFYPDVDLQFITDKGNIETNFILNSKQVFADGWLALNQNISVPDGLRADQSKAILEDGKRKGYLLMRDGNDENYFYFNPAHAYDANESSTNFIDMPYELVSDKLSYFVPVKWLNDQSTVYPVVIDPYVSAADSLSEYAVRGSGYTAVCDENGCSYSINNLNMPANVEVTNIQTRFAYLAMLPCGRQDGGFQIIMKTATDTCYSRHFSCLGAIQGGCFFWPAQLLNAVPPFSPCIPAPQCLPYSLDFELKLRRCNWIPTGGCDSTCISSYAPWVMEIIGRTIEINNISLTQSLCQGSCTNVAATADWGVGTYSFTWQPGNLVGDAVNVCPDSTTTYFVTASDTCGNTDTASTTVTVVQGQNPGFTIFPNDSVCGGTQMTFTANGNDPDSLFSWYIECQSIDTTENSKVVIYNAPSVPSICTATMIYGVANGPNTCEYTLTDTFYVLTGTSPSVTINGPDSICAGGTGTYEAINTFGGTAPLYQWSLNGVNIPGADSAIYSSTFVNGDQLVVLMTSTDSCSSGTTVTDTIHIYIANYTSPQITIHTSVDTICSGYQELYTTSIHNFGANPYVLWYQNGLLIDTGLSFLTTVNFGDEIVAMLIAGLACTLNDTATDTSTVIVLPLTPPEVDILQSPDTVCAGDTITFSASLSNIAIPPAYRWYLNGGFMELTPTFTWANFNSGDTVVVRIITPNPCGQDTAYDSTYVVINPIDTPQISISISADTICAGDTVTFSASAIDGGNSPSYSWYVNGFLSGNDSTYTTAPLSSTDIITVWLTSSNPCALIDSVSDTVSVTVIPSVIPTINISASEDTICEGDLVTFVAMTTGGGSSPTFQWQVNGIDVLNETSSVFTTALLHPGDSVSIQFFSNQFCADPDSASDYFPIVVESCLGLNESQQSDFTMHPNPVSDELIIEFSGNQSSPKNIFITDVTGRIIKEILNVEDKKVALNVSDLSPAVYFIDVSDNGRHIIRKVVVE